MRPNLSLGDTLAGLHAAFGIVMALLHRQRHENKVPGQVCAPNSKSFSSSFLALTQTSAGDQAAATCCGTKLLNHTLVFSSLLLLLLLLPLLSTPDQSQTPHSASLIDWISDTLSQGYASLSLDRH